MPSFIDHISDLENIYNTVVQENKEMEEEILKLEREIYNLKGCITDLEIENCELRDTLEDAIVNRYSKTACVTHPNEYIRAAIKNAGNNKENINE